MVSNLFLFVCLFVFGVTQGRVFIALTWLVWFWILASTCVMTCLKMGIILLLWRPSLTVNITAPPISKKVFIRQMG